ncbi:MAG: hypothetical protein ACLGJB_00425 [Blastocatellia bacterium]
MPDATNHSAIEKAFVIAMLEETNCPNLESAPLHRRTEARHSQARQRKIVSRPLSFGVGIQNQHRMRIGLSTVKRVEGRILEDMNPKPAKPVWQFYERGHPHILWHGDSIEKIVLTRDGKTAYQFTLLDDYSRAYVHCSPSTEPDEVNVVGGIAAVREHQAIPKALLFDNGQICKSTYPTSVQDIAHIPAGRHQIAEDQIGEIAQKVERFLDNLYFNRLLLKAENGTFKEHTPSSAAALAQIASLSGGHIPNAKEETIRNLREQSLADIWYGAGFLSFRKIFEQESECSSCGLQPSCNRCPAHSYLETGNLLQCAPNERHFAELYRDFQAARA